MRRLITAFGQLLGSSLASQLIGFGVLAVVARRAGAYNLGAYGWASNLVGWLVLPMSGLAGVTQRAIARDKDAAARLGGDAIPILAVYSILAMVVIWVVAPLVAPTPTASTMLRIVSFTIGATLLTTDWWVSAFGEFGKLAVARLAGQVVYGVTALAWLTSGRAEAFRFAWLNVLDLVVTLLIAWAVTLQLSGMPRVTRSVSRPMRRLRTSLHFTMSLAMIRVYYTADFVLLGFLSTSTAVGNYTVAYRLPLGLLGVAGLWNSVVFTYASTANVDMLRARLRSWLTAILVLVVPVCAGAGTVAGPLVRALFGGGYGSAAGYFRLLMIAAALGVVNGVFAPILLATEDERALSRIVTAGAVVNLGLNIVMIPVLGPTGAAIATICAESAVLVPLLRNVAARYGRPSVDWLRVLGSALASVAMVLVLRLGLADTSVWIQITVGATSYAVMALTLGAVRVSDFRAVAQPTPTP